MALITCEDCGRSISDRAPSCPHCGAPTTTTRPPPLPPPFQQAAAATLANKGDQKSRLGLKVFLAIVGTVSLLIILGQLGNRTTGDDGGAVAVQPKAAAAAMQPITTPEAPSPQRMKAGRAIDYDLLARSPSTYVGQLVFFRGKVVQATQGGQSYMLRVNVTRGTYNIWTDTIYVEYLANSSDARILEGDLIQLWGEFVGIKSYTAVLGNTIQIPQVLARVIEVDEIAKAIEREPPPKPKKRSAL